MTPLDVALAHAAAGRRVFPADPEHKRPLITGWQTLATTDAEVIRAWWAERSDAMPAWALPADVGVVDADPRNGASAETTPGELPATRTADTAGGGAHFFYRVPADRPIKNGKIVDGWDCKTAGGYVVLDGATRADGKRYELAADLPIADAPEWLLVAKAREKAIAAPVDPPVVWAAPEGVAETMTPAIVALLAPRFATRGQRHEVARAIGGAFALAGWTDEDIAALVGALPSDNPGARVADALAAAGRARGGELAPQWGALERAGYAPGVVAAMRTMADGGKLDALAATAAAAWTAQAVAASTKAEACKVSDVYAKIDPVPWVCEALRIAPGAPTLVAGYGGVGKSMFVQLLAVCIVTGRPFLGMPVRKGRVRHYDYEQGKRITLTRYQRLAAAMGVDANALESGLDIVPGPDFRLTDPAARERLVEECSGYTLAVFDALRGAAAGLDENDSRFREPLDMLLGVSDATACVMLALHHARKASKDNAAGGNQNMRGSSAINDASQTVIMLESASHGFNVECGKVRDGSPFKAFGIEIRNTPIARDDVNFEGLALEVVDGVARKQTDARTEQEADCQAVLAFIANLPGARFKGGYKTLYAAMGRAIGRDRVQTALGLLVATGRAVHDERTNTYIERVTT